MQFGPGGQYESYYCVFVGERPRSHIIVCPPVVRLPDDTYYCVMGPFPL